MLPSYRPVPVSQKFALGNWWRAIKYAKKSNYKRLLRAISGKAEPIFSWWRREFVGGSGGIFPQKIFSILHISLKINLDKV